MLLPVRLEQNRYRHLTQAMNALKNSRRTLVALIALLVCLSGSWGLADVFEEKVMQFRNAAEQEN